MGGRTIAFSGRWAPFRVEPDAGRQVVVRFGEAIVGDRSVVVFWLVAARKDSRGS